MAITGVSTREMRRILLDEGVFTGVALADAAVLAMYWQARDSDEYQYRRIALETS
jgi:hypothetical protein